MPSYTTSLRLIQPATGEYSGTWGTQVNNGITALVDAAVAGTASITMTAADYTLSNNNGASDEARAMFLVLQGTPGASYFVIVPTVSKLYFVTNNTGFAQRISTSTTPGSGISVPNGASMTLRCDGTNVVEALNAFGNLTYTGTLTGSTSILNIGSGQIYKDGSGNLGIGTSSPAGKVDSVSNATAAYVARASTAGANQTADVLTTFNSDASLYALARYNAVQHIWRYAGTTEGMRLDSSGNLGIGTISPGAKLHVKVGTNQNLLTTSISSKVTNLAVDDAGSGYVDWQQYANQFLWFTASTERMTLDTSGNLGIGTSSPGEKLAVNQGNIYAVRTGGAKLRLADQNNEVSVESSPTGVVSNMIFKTAAATQMTLDSSGNLGIGISSPQAVLHVNKATTSTFRLSATNVGIDIQSLDGAGYGLVSTYTNHPLVFSTNATERARITSGGDFGINGTPPTDSQFYSKNSAAGKFAGTFENHDAGGYGISIGTANTNLAFFYPNASRTGSPVGAITTNGSSTSYVTSSDRRLKEGIAPAADAGPIIDAIEVVQHDWKVGGHTRFGVIAQDLNAVAPEAVSAGDDGDEIKKTWGVDYSKLVPMLIKEIQTLRARVAALEAK